MARRGKRRQRHRLIRWAAPLFRGAEPGADVEAIGNLTRDDWDIVRLYGLCHDQMCNLFPFAEEQQLVPRLEGWLAACELLDVPKADRVRRLALARALHDAVQGHVSSDERLAANLADPRDLVPPAPPE